ncbi:MAG: RNA polymerase sigma-I factor [Bacillota bacterium]
MPGKPIFGNPRRPRLLSDLRQVKRGDAQLREQLLQDYQPFILKTVSRVTGKYVEIENSEEFSVGLMAFNEAIDCFDERKNPNFLAFCEYVIRRRTIDFLRKTKNDARVYPFTCFEDEDGNFQESYLVKENEQIFIRQSETVEIKEQIEAFAQELAQFGITLGDLVRCSPKHKDSRQTAIETARTLAGRDELYQCLMKSKKIPLVELAAAAGVRKRLIEKNRKFIIAVCLILRSSHDVLRNYIPNAGEGRDIR